MDSLRIASCLLLTCTAAALSAPGDRIDIKQLKDKISLKIGTKGTIQFKHDGDLLAKPKLMKDLDEKTPGIDIEFSRKEQLITLRVKNRFPKTLRYRAAKRVRGQREFVETSIIPIAADLISFESWPDPIQDRDLFAFTLRFGPSTQ